MNEMVRLIKQDELEKLLSLYQYLNPDDLQLVLDHRLQQHWNDIQSDPFLFYFVIEEDGLLVSSCALAIIKNLTRSARPYALIENVVTRSEYRKKGYGTAVLQKAVETAKDQDCYKVMLMTGKKDERTLRFYEQAGFARGEKTGFIIRL